MSFANVYYVNATATGGGVGSEADPWTPAEAAAGASAGSLVWVKSGAYSSSGITFSNAGTDHVQASATIHWRGYNTAVGDLDGQGRNADTTLDSSNFPVFTMSGPFIQSAYTTIMNIKFTGSIAGPIVGSSSLDRARIIHCIVENTANSSSAQALVFDDYCDIINCDFICSGTSNGDVVEFDSGTSLYYSRISAASSAGACVNGRGGNTIGNFFIGGGGDGYYQSSSGGVYNVIMINNTFYNCASCFSSYSGSAQDCIVLNNHVTDSSSWFTNLYTTADILVFESNSRTRDITTPRSGLDADSINAAEVTTDTGGASTDYTNAGNGDLTLINSAPGVSAGMGGGYWNIGAAQSEPGSGGGGLLTHPGMAGGMNG